MPKTVPHFFHNASVGEPAEVFGIYVGAGDVAATGYGFCGKPTEADLARAEAHTDEPLRYPVVRVDDVSPDTTDIGWRGTDFRPLLATSNVPAAFCFVATVAPGGSRAQHMLPGVDTYYLVHEGTGLAGDGKAQAELRAGHVWWVPAGTSSWLRNVDQRAPSSFRLSCRGSRPAASIASSGRRPPPERSRCVSPDSFLFGSRAGGSWPVSGIAGDFRPRSEDRAFETSTVRRRCTRIASTAPSTSRATAAAKIDACSPIGSRTPVRALTCGSARNVRSAC